MGPPPFISFHDIYASPGAFINHWGTRFCILYIFPTFILFCCTNTRYYQPLFLSSPLATCFPVLATRNPCHPWLETPFSFFLILTSSISSEHNPGLLPLSSAFIYFVPPLAQLTSDLVVPTTLYLVSTVAATPYIIHPPTKGSLASPHFLTSYLYLCLLIPSVDSMEYLVLLGVASPFCRHQHTFPKG
jgi:hypothetical protein